MSVHYKFKSALDFDTITFDGLHISVSDLKKAIIQQKRLGKSSDFDLQITNAQTKEEYADDSVLIPKNTSLIIARIPLAVQPKKPWDPHADKIQGNQRGGNSGGGSNAINESTSGTLDLSQMNGTEEDKIQAMMIQSTMDYDPNNYQKIRGQGQTGEVPANYRCFKCHKPGHWIKNCPLGANSEHTEVKRNTGIPRSFIERDAQEKIAEHPPEPPPPMEKKQEIPEDLICSICKDLLTDAVMIPCCGSSFCDECVRTALLESEDNECPDCGEKGSSPGLLIPNRFLRNSVNAFRNETGYNKPRQQKQEPPKATSNEDTNQQQQQQQQSPITPTPSAPSSQDQDYAEENQTREETTKEIINDVQKGEEKETEKGSSPGRDKRENEVEANSNAEMKKTVDAAAHSSHDENESDFEDNITVTVPPAHLQSQRAAYRERHYNGRHSRHIKPPGIDNSPKSNSNSQTSPSREMRSNTPTIDEHERMLGGTPPEHHKSHPVPTHPGHGQPMRPIRPTSDMYGGAPPMSSYGQHQPQPPPMMVPGRPPYEMAPYGSVPHGPGYMPYVRGPYQPVRPGYHHPMHHPRPRNAAPIGNLASVYQGVQAKVGSGIIDDPLEAFNRIMREKEKRKGERRRTPERRRSRSIEMNSARGRHLSPPYHGRSRNRISEERRVRSPPPRERRGRSRDKRSVDKERRRNRSSSFSDRSSRSRSWSMPRKRSKSPAFRRRSRSRSQSFSVSRSRSRSNSQGRFRGPQPPLRYNRSPLNTISPRYRQKENRRPDRRDDFQRDEFRDRSPPEHYMQRRPRSRGRISPPQNTQYFRQDNRSFNHGGQDEYFHHHHHHHHQGPGGQSSNAGMYNDNYQQYNRYHPRDTHIPPHRGGDSYGVRDRGNIEYKDRFDDVPPPGTEEPPPPGFENSPQQRERRGSWGHSQSSYGGAGSNEYRKQQHDDNQKDYDDMRLTPELRDRQSSLDREDRRRFGRDGRSWSRSSFHSPGNPSRMYEKGERRSRSKTPRFNKNQDYPIKERNPNKDRYPINRDIQVHGSDREKLDYDKKRERTDDRERERKHGDHSKEKKDAEKKSHDTETRHVTKDDKEKEKSKLKEQEKEKEKKRDSSDDEKKDKKSKEKRKKKKEKDEKKRIKKEKKEKEKKEKEKEREKGKEGKKDEDHVPENNNRENGTEEKLTENNHNDKAFVTDSSIETKHELQLESSTEETLNLQQSVESQHENENESELEKKENMEKFELYGDICQEEEIRYDYVNIQAEDNKTDSNKRDSPKEIKRSDSILDIHTNLDFEPDLEEMANNGDNRKETVLVPLPELSKWERDEEYQSMKDEKGSLSDNAKANDDKSKVTNEVIRRAENAIFARAINAIRPIEIKKISVERQKLYANEPTSDSSPTSVSNKVTSPKPELQTFQITVPTSSNASERSVEIKQDKLKRPASPVRSVKDRLGSKITEHTPQKRMRSRSISPVRKMHADSGRDKLRSVRSKSKDFKKDDIRDLKRGIDSGKRIYDNRPHSRDKFQKDFKFNDFRMRDNRFRNNDRRRDFQHNDRKRDKFRDQDRNRDNFDKDRRKSLEKFRNKGFDNERNNVKDYDRNRERDKDYHKKWDKEKVNRRERSQSKSSDRESRKDKALKKDRDTKKWQNEEERTRSSEREAKEKNEKNSSKKDENQTNDNPVISNDEQSKEVTSSDKVTTSESIKKTEKNSKVKNQTLHKRSRTRSPSSSSSSSSEDESDSESEEKKKKKKKHKREKKRSRRSSSVESSNSTKHKRSKSKKKKSSKKKKKSKK